MAESFDVYDGKGTKVVDNKPSKVVIDALASNTELDGYKAAYAGVTDPDGMLTLPAITTTPAKPTITATAGDGSFTFSIKQGATDGATVPVTFTVMTATDGKTFTSKDSATATGTISSLTNGTTVTVKAVAKNVAGSSDESDTITVTPKASSNG